MLIQFFYFIYAEIFTNFNFHMSHTCGTVVHTEAARRKDAPCQWVCVCVCGGVCIVCVSAYYGQVCANTIKSTANVIMGKVSLCTVLYTVLCTVLYTGRRNKTNKAF